VRAYRLPHHCPTNAWTALGKHRAQGSFPFRSEHVVGMAAFSRDSESVDMVFELVVRTRFGDTVPYLERQDWIVAMADRILAVQMDLLITPASNPVVYLYDEARPAGRIKRPQGIAEVDND
jgi:hypothetical protein